MKNTRTYIAVAAMAASVTLLAACSNEDDTAPPADTTMPPLTTPADPVTPSSPMTPTDPMRPDTQPGTDAPITPAPSSSMSDQPADAAIQSRVGDGSTNS